MTQSVTLRAARRVALLVSTCVLGGLLHPAGGLAGPQPTAVPSAASADAIRFRTEMGLAADRETVESLAATRPLSPAFGIPLTSEEEAILVERLRIQSQLNAVRSYARTERATWGGLWLSYPIGATVGHATTVNMAMTKVPAGLDAAALSALLPEGADMVTHEARFTLDELEALHSVIAKEVDFFKAIGTEIYSASTDVRTNVVEIVVATLSADIDRAIRARFPEGMVRPIVGGPVLPDACIRTNCGPPWRGGIRITRAGPASCTSGFVAVKGSSYAVLTAGHCGTATWRQGSTSGTIIGTTSENYWVNMTDADVQVIPFTPATERDDDYLTGNVLCNPCAMADVRIAECKCDEIGQIVRNSGAFTGTTAPATLVHTSVTHFYMGNTYIRQRRATYPRALGDSGGPVTTGSGSPVVWDVAVGLHSDFQVISGTQYAIYSHIAEIKEISGWSVYTTGD